MGAYNWVRFDARCPQCGEQARMRAQCHVASSYDADRDGRFFDIDYAVGQRMRWWSPDDPRHSSWRAGAQIEDTLRDRAVECCHASCLRCQAALYATIEFESATAMAVADLGLEADWPADFGQ